MRYRVLLRKINATRKWQVWVAAIDRSRLKLKGPSPKLPFNTLPTYNFDTKEDALTVVMQVGYALKLGDFMYTWLDEEEG